MSVPVAIRFDDSLLEEVRRVARRRATTVSSVIQMFAEEGIRAMEIPGIVFRDGPSGRRPGVAGSVDVWEIIATARQMDGPVDQTELASIMGVDRRVVEIAIDYYSHFPDEIDQWIADGESEAERAHEAWLKRTATLQNVATQ